MTGRIGCVLWLGLWLSACSASTEAIDLGTGGFDAGGGPADGARAEAGQTADTGTAPETGPVADSGAVEDLGAPAEDATIGDSGPTPVSDSGALPDAGPVADAAAPPDAAPAADAGGSLDAGARSDAGPVDAGFADAGARDAGSADAGSATDAGTPCTSNADCGGAFYCSGRGCGTPGVCAARPRICAPVFSQVCGCDGRTYGNTCEANAAGTRVASNSACATSCNGTQCGAGEACCDTTGRCYASACLACCMGRPNCRSNRDCTVPDEYCAADGCGTPGTCTPRPTLCSRVLDPVCGCDGRDYGNPCMAGMASVRVAYRGACGTVDLCAGVLCGRPQICCPSDGQCCTPGSPGCCL